MLRELRTGNREVVLSVCSSCLTGLRRQRTGCLRASGGEELPRAPDLLDHVEIQLCDHHFIFVTACLRNDFAARIAKITLAVKLPNAPRLLLADAVNRSNKIAIRHCMRRLLEFPQILGKPGHRRRRIEYDLSAIQAENSRALRKMTVVANVH